MDVSPNASTGGTSRGDHPVHRRETPVNVFRHGNEYVFALTYGSDVDWVKNVLAAGGCDISTRGRDFRLVEPVLIVDPKRRLMPFPVRIFLGLDAVNDLLRMRAD